MAQIQHIVLVKMKPEVTTEKITLIFTLLAELQQLIPGITYFAGGPYSSPEGMNQDYTHGFMMTFESVDARNNYLPHPEHERVKGTLLTCIDNVISFDERSLRRRVIPERRLYKTKTIKLYSHD